ncbi:MULTISPECIES: aminoglycoside phosphotransferase family protein [unclassified Paenibacillus]|uniref:aminoglycoside phosphotransferase family protein n=1 Tax=unclassified Paenibacillus TaxID=185978 RepID=UPI0030F584FC
MNKIKAILKNHYDKDIINVLPQQGGWAALAYKVSTNKRSYFLKVYEKRRASTPKWTALIDEYVPIMVWIMHNSGLKGKIPVPLLTKSGDFKCEDDDGIFLLYEYINGETIGDKALNEEQVCQLSEIITELHSFGAETPIETDAVKEDFCVPFLQQLRSTLDKEYKNIPDDVREVINPHIEQILGLVDTIEKLSICVENSRLRMALCHTDIHHWNLMQSENQLILIDWEGLRLAPVEADLMCLVDEPYYAEFLSTYQKIHKNFAINPDALQFYQVRRKLEDIWEFIEQLLFDKQNAQERANTINSLAKELKDINE